MNINEQLQNPSFIDNNKFIDQLVKKGFEGNIKIYGKPVKIAISPAACRQLNQQASLLLVEIELYFSCLIRKRVLFSTLEQAPEDSDDTCAAIPGLYVRFSPVTTKECRVSDNPDGPLSEAMPIKQPARFVPDWLTIDYRRNKWVGEYSFKR